MPRIFLFADNVFSKFAKKISMNISLLTNPDNHNKQHLLLKLITGEFNKRDIYHDLMLFKVKEILLIADLYDAFSIEREGRVTDIMLGEYANLNLSTLPRISTVTNSIEALSMLNSSTRRFDLIIMMVGVNKQSAIDTARLIKKERKETPIYLLLNNNSNLAFFSKPDLDRLYSRIFVYNGESSVFFSMVKNLEDLKNVKNDVQIASVRVILVVEDSPLYYSRYLALLYRLIFKQTQDNVSEISKDKLYKILKLRARPKVLLATTYEEAMEIYNQYQDNLIGLISDVRFPKDNKSTKDAGFQLIERIKKERPELPIIIQSSEGNNEERAIANDVDFINKNSDNLEFHLKEFIRARLGFGDFVFRDKTGKKLAVAKTIEDFQKQIHIVDIESILYHAMHNHFSMWAMARSEIQLAKILGKKKVRDFQDKEEVRNYLIDSLDKFMDDSPLGKVIPFSEKAFMEESNIVMLADGALGGKGRGLAFLNSLIHRFDFNRFVPDINIKIPRTAIIGTNEFVQFMDSNNLHFVKEEPIEDAELKALFLQGKLSKLLSERLRKILQSYTLPLAIRSSGLFEDSLMQPFAGIFETYLLPNNHPDIEIRLQQTLDAIKMVYASVYSAKAKSYIKAINYKVDEEKMAIVIQAVVGKQYDNIFYPHISGVAQSYNFYPYGHMKPEEGFSVMAFGLGTYVVEGEKAFRYSPRYPTTQLLSLDDQLANSQTYFYAVDLDKKTLHITEGEMAGLVKKDLYIAEKQNTLKHCVSTYDANSHMLSAGLDKAGPRVVNFANIIKHNYAPLSKIQEVFLDVLPDAFGTPVEIEFSMDLNKDKSGNTTFYLLQVKPMLKASNDTDFKIEEFDHQDTLLYTEKGMGNGTVDYISDVIFIKNDAFLNSKTQEMANEIEILNRKMQEQRKQYILIGPGRWGSRDKWIGIPVQWAQISNAKVIVETSLEGFPLEASFGSHFFHNVITMNVGYFSVLHSDHKSFINYDLLNQQETMEETTYFKHIKTKIPVRIIMDGKKRQAIIVLNKNNTNP
jgi:CheY-like chemotaxis protein